MKKPKRPTLKGYGITEDQVRLYRSFITQRDNINQIGNYWEDGQFSLWYKHSIVFACIIAVWWIHRSEESFLSAVFSGIFAGGFGGVIPGGITSHFHKKGRDKEIKELSNTLLVDMDVVTVRRYVEEFDKYQYDLGNYEYLKSQK